MSLSTLFHPERFQGNLNRKKYFEGWYFKQVSAARDHVLAIIPGVSLAGNRHAFIQIIDGISGFTEYLEYPLSDFQAQKDRMEIRIGENLFTNHSMDLNIQKGHVRLSGHLDFHNTVPWPSSRFTPGIMGWYGFVPRMECYHGVVSLDHDISGRLSYLDQTLDFTGGRGYIEKDWGTSMPESWIWMHANTFETPGTSIMLSVAKIPWLGSFFVGFLCFVLHEGILYRFMTYNRSRITSLKADPPAIDLEFANRHHTISIRARQKKAGKLKAPVKGIMERYIKESIDSEVHITLKSKEGTVILDGSADKVGLELVGNLEELINFATR